MQAGHPVLVRTRLSAMMFMQFFIWGGWMFAITGYTSTVLHFTGPQIGMLVSTTAIGAIIAPLFVGYVADRLFATERILSVLHLLGGGCLLLAAQQKTYGPMLTLMMLNGLFYMPTLALANSLAFRHLPDPSKFPRIAVLGTIGFIVVNLIVQLALGGATTSQFLALSGGAGVLMAVYSLTLPHTPPKGGAGKDVFGLGALKLLKDPSFLTFTLCAFLVTIPSCAFFTCATPMLQERGYPAPLALMTLNQCSEIVLMFTMPLFVVWLGLKRVLAIGMLAWTLRYLCFAADSFSFAIAGLLLHGFCYSFVFVGAYMFVDSHAPADIKASAQSLIAFLMLGVAWMVGCNVSGSMMEMPRFQAPVSSMPAVELVAVSESGGQQQSVNREQASLPRWDDPAAAQSAWRYLDLAGVIERYRKGDDKSPPAEPDLGQKLDADYDGAITLAELQKVPDGGLSLGKFVYSRDELIKVFQKIAAIKKADVPASEIRVTRADWIAAQSHDWKRFWLWPAAAAFAVCLLFVLAYRERPIQET
jgi:nucleoside transporter